MFAFILEKLKMQLAIASRKGSFETGQESAFEMHNEYNNFNANPTPIELSDYASIKDWMFDTANPKLKLRYSNGRHAVMGDSRISHMMRFKKQT